METPLTLQPLLFGSPSFLSFSDFPCFLVRFPLFSKDFRGSAKRRIPLLFSGFPFHFFTRVEVFDRD